MAADFDTLVSGLRAWTKDHDLHVRAAIELLIWHEHWIRSAAFQKAAVGWDSRRRVAHIDWDDAAAYETNGRGSSSELAVLRVAVALGRNDFRLSIMGSAHAKAIVTAFAQALGVEVPGGR